MKHYIVAGLGVTGVSAVHYLKKRGFQVSILDHRKTSQDLETLSSLYPDISIHTGPFPEAVLKSADEIVLSPGIPQNHPDLLVIQGKVPLINDIELFAREVKAPVVAITGSNAKSTVTTLVGEMAKNARIRVGVGGNLGIPALSLLEENHELFVLELSSFQLELLNSLKPKVATILNLSPDHLDRYNSLEEYYLAKQRIFLGCESAVVNREDQTVIDLLPRNLPFITFGLDDAPFNHFGLKTYQNEEWLTYGEPLLPVSALKLRGRHNVANVLAALALGIKANIPLSAMLDTLKTFKGLAHRCEWVREKSGVLWINDSKGTNVGASVAALEGLGSSISGKWVLIAGGEGKNADFSLLRPVVEKYCKAVVLIGKDAPQLYDILHETMNCHFAKDMQEAVAQAAQLTQSGDGVLLSPACASLDMFKNYEHRGVKFKEIVEAL